jgi:hypothetical protein
VNDNIGHDVGGGGACPRRRGLAKIGKKGEADEQSCLGRIKKNLSRAVLGIHEILVLGQIIITPVKIVGSRCATAKLSAALTSHLFGPLVTNFLEMAFHLPETLDKNLDGTFFRIRIELMRIRIHHFF